MWLMISILHTFGNKPKILFFLVFVYLIMLDEFWLNVQRNGSALTKVRKQICWALEFMTSITITQYYLCNSKITTNNTLKVSAVVLSTNK